MKTEMRIILTFALLFGGVGCAHQENPLQSYTAAILACADGIDGGRPDGRCGTFGDRPLQITVSLKDIFGKPLSKETQTDENGSATLRAKTEVGNSLLLSVPETILVDGEFYQRPNNPWIVKVENNISIEIPYNTKKKPNDASENS